VTHLDVSTDDIDEALGRITTMLHAQPGLRPLLDASRDLWEGADRDDSKRKRASVRPQSRGGGARSIEAAAGFR
jgi:hypothetical protein